jgi:hypothetical protein
MEIRALAIGRQPVVAIGRLDMPGDGMARREVMSNIRSAKKMTPKIGAIFRKQLRGVRKPNIRRHRRWSRKP